MPAAIAKVSFIFFKSKEVVWFAGVLSEVSQAILSNIPRLDLTWLNDSLSNGRMAA